MAQNNASQFYQTTIPPNVSQSDTPNSKPPKIDHAKYLLAMCYSFFSLLSFCYHVYWFINPWGTCFPDYTLAGLLFSLIRNPRGYQDIGTSPFPDSFRFAKSRMNPKHHRDWKTQTSSTKYWSRPRVLFPLFHRLGTPIWKYWPSQAFNDSMGRRIIH